MATSWNGSSTRRSPSKYFRNEHRPRNNFLQDVSHLRAKTFSGMERHPQNNFLQDVPDLRASTLSGTECQPQNNFPQDEPPLRANTLSGTECHPGTTFCRTCHLLSKYFVGDGASAPELLSAGHATSRANTLSGTECQPRNYFLQDVPPPRANTLSGGSVDHVRRCDSSAVCRSCSCVAAVLFSDVVVVVVVRVRVHTLTLTDTVTSVAQRTV